MGVICEHDFEDKCHSLHSKWQSDHNQLRLHIQVNRLLLQNKT